MCGIWPVLGHVLVKLLSSSLPPPGGAAACCRLPPAWWKVALQGLGSAARQPSGGCLPCMLGCAAHPALCTVLHALPVRVNSCRCGVQHIVERGTSVVELPWICPGALGRFLRWAGLACCFHQCCTGRLREEVTACHCLRDCWKDGVLVRV